MAAHSLKHGRSKWAASTLLGALAAGQAYAHGDVTPQAVDTHTLPQLGPNWLAENPYRDGRVYMPPFEHALTQEAIWAIKSYLETRRTSD